MPICKLYRNGSTLGVAPRMTNPNPVKRSTITGWSARSARSQRVWFYSIEVDKLTGYGFSFTLTIRDCPSSPDKFHAMRDAFIKRLRRDGSVRTHWLIEWQRRQVPHFHGCVYFDPSVNIELIEEKIINHWCAVSNAYTSAPFAQKVLPIYETVGWLKYLAKHGARGVNHYQRSNDNIPPGWVKTGRMWGYTGDWPIGKPSRIELDYDGYYVLRRIQRRWAISEARKRYEYSNIVKSRQLLKCNDKDRSKFIGVSLWIPSELMTLMVAFVASMGYKIHRQSVD